MKSEPLTLHALCSAAVLMTSTILSEITCILRHCQSAGEQLMSQHINDDCWEAVWFAPMLPAAATRVRQHAVRCIQTKPFPWSSSASLSFEWLSQIWLPTALPGGTPAISRKTLLLDRVDYKAHIQAVVGELPARLSCKAWTWGDCSWKSHLIIRCWKRITGKSHPVPGFESTGGWQV